MGRCDVHMELRLSPSSLVFRSFAPNININNNND